MNFAKQQGSKSIFSNQRHFYKTTMKDQNQKSGKKIPFDISTRKIKYLGINLTKEIKDLYSKNYTTLKKDIKKSRKTRTNGNMYHVHGLEELTSSKCPYYPKQFIDSTKSLLKYQ